MRELPICIAISALAAFGDPEQGPKPAPAPAGEVRMSLVTDRVQIAPGETFEVGVRLEVAEGYHVGWQNPGDVGRPTTARLAAPEGFRVEGPMYPAPEAIEFGEGVVAYGYETEALIVFRVTPPEGLAESERVELTASAEWTAIGKSIVPGRAKASASVPAYPARDETPSDVSGALSRWRPLMPQPWRKLERARSTWRTLWLDSGEGAGLVLKVEIEGATALEFFPLPTERTDYSGQQTSALADGRALEIEARLYAQGAHALPDVRGLLRVVRDGALAVHELHEIGPAPSTD